MRILHLINVRWFNATAWYAFRLAKAGIKAGDTAVIAGLPDSPVVNIAKAEGIETLESNFNSNNIIIILKNLKKLLTFIKKNRPNAVVCHRGEMYWFIDLYKYLFRPAWKLIRVRGDVRPPTTGWLSRFTHNICADRIITSAGFIRNYFLNGLESDEEHVKTIYGGVDTEYFKPDSMLRKRKRNDFGFSESDYVVSVVGRFDPVKGYDIFLKACAKVFKIKKNMKILISGFPRNISSDEMNNMILKNGLSDITTVLDTHVEINEIMNTCDLGVVSSVGSEAICRVAMEFMACGITVVSSNAGVLPEVIPSENVYPMHDDDILAEKILHHIDYKKIYSENDFYSEFKNTVISA